MSDWQPIYTAPEDGTEIIGWNYDCVEIIHWEADPNETWGDRPCWNDRDSEPFYATHWLAIPATPDLPEPPEAP